MIFWACQLLSNLWVYSSFGGLTAKHNPSSHQVSYINSSKIYLVTFTLSEAFQWLGRECHGNLSISIPLTEWYLFRLHSCFSSSFSIEGALLVESFWASYCEISLLSLPGYLSFEGLERCVLILIAVSNSLPAVPPLLKNGHASR